MASEIWDEAVFTLKGRKGDSVGLSKEEVWRALEKLSDAEYKQIQIRAKTLVQGLVNMSFEDLIQETATAFLSGDRTFPRDVAPVAVMFKAMHSEASNARERQKNGAINQYVEVSELTDVDEDDSNVVSIIPSHSLTPERIAADRQIFNLVMNSLASEPDLRELAIAWSMRLTGQDAADYLGWEMNVYETTRKRLHRRLDKIKEEIK